MYESMFNFRSRPFVSAPLAKNYFPAATTEAARTTLERLVERGEGPGLIIGPPGTGKTLLCQMLAQRFKGPLAVALLTGGRLKTCEAMLQAILYELGEPCRGLDEGELRLVLMDYLEPKTDGPEALLLLVDEAHTVSFRVLDELRLLSNLVRGGQPRVRLVLAGGPKLEERFASPKMSSFAQRVAGRCYLEPLDGPETTAYVRAHISAAGGDPDKLLDETALRNIYRASDGIPRLINQVCDHAFVLASLGGHRHLTGDAIDEAWADLQQLPAPWSQGNRVVSPPSDIIEFGELEDDTDEMPKAIPFRKQPSEEDLRRTQPLNLAEPDEQIEAIAEHLAKIDNEPPAMIGATEVDLDFPEFGDPFAEEFAEEELVVDPYLLDTEIFADVPRVSSWEGRQLGSLLEPLQTDSRPKQANRPKMKLTEAAPSPEIIEPAAVESAEVDAALDWDFSPASDPVFPEEPAAEASPVSLDKPAAEAHPLSLDEPVTPSDEQRVIVIEDEPAMLRLGAPRPVRREFRQLFSKLRRG